MNMTIYTEELAEAQKKIEKLKHEVTTLKECQKNQAALLQTAEESIRNKDEVIKALYQKQGELKVSVATGGERSLDYKNQRDDIQYRLNYVEQLVTKMRGYIFATWDQIDFPPSKRKQFLSEIQIQGQIINGINRHSINSEAFTDRATDIDEGWK